MLPGGQKQHGQHPWYTGSEDRQGGIPSHDTLNRVMGLLSTEILQQLYRKWQELLNRNEGVKQDICEKKGYACTVEKAHGQLEKREYYQTEDIKWLSQKKEWKGIKSIGMEEKGRLYVGGGIPCYY